MKKVFVLSLVLFLFISTYYYKGFSSYIDELPTGVCTIYSSQATTCQEYSSVHNIEHYITTVSSNELNKVKNSTKGIIGISHTFNGSKECIQDYLKVFDAEMVKEQTIDGVIIVYAYSSRIKDNVTVGDNKINIQIAVNRGKVTIGSPLIIGSYWVMNKQTNKWKHL